MVTRFFAAFVFLCLTATAKTDEVQRLADRIDSRLADQQRAAGVQPAERCNDAHFLRRVYLDLYGVIPTPAALRVFLSNPAKDKRSSVVDELLDGAGYVRHFSAVWRGLLVGEDRVDADLEAWLRVQFAANLPYDRLARSILTQSLEPPQRGEPTPLAFFRGRADKPEELAASVSRIFLGVRLECAQCHDHPFASWKREQFWSQAAFFTRDERATLEIPAVGKVVTARFLDGANPPQGKQSPRQTLADWLTARDNPYFARALANRLWSHFFGVGIVEPADDFSDINPPSHPELLDDLAAALVAQKYDSKFLIRAMLRSRAYQVASRGGVPVSPPLFERRAVRLLTPEQLHDSLVLATGYPVSAVRRAAFLARFPRPESRVDAAIGIPQALALMNGPLTRLLTDPQQSPALAAIAEAPFLNDREKVETLFLATLSRPPRPGELQTFLAHVEKAPGAKALSDVLWALINSAEFMHHH